MGSALAAGVALVGGVGDAAAAEPADMPPQPGDQFVFFSGPKKGQVIKVEDLKVGGPQVVAYPFDPVGQITRSGTRLNTIVLARFADADLTAATRQYAAEGVVVYSAVCTHQGCSVSMWKKDNSTLFCACHGSEYDPKDSAAVVAGPAPRALAMLPIDIADGTPVAKAPFTDKVGFQP